MLPADIRETAIYIKRFCLKSMGTKLLSLCRFCTEVRWEGKHASDIIKDGGTEGTPSSDIKV